MSQSSPLQWDGKTERRKAERRMPLVAPLITQAFYRKAGHGYTTSSEQRSSDRRRAHSPAVRAEELAVYADAMRWRYVVTNGFPQLVRVFSPNRSWWHYVIKGASRQFDSPQDAIDAAMRAEREGK